MVLSGQLHVPESPLRKEPLSALSIEGWAGLRAGLEK
jgi:hypothetical protein